MAAEESAPDRQNGVILDARYARDLIGEYLRLDDSYFNAKETLAHAILGAELAFLVGFIGLGSFNKLPAPGLTGFCVFTLWLTLHIYLRRQLRFARWANTHSTTARNILRRWSIRDWEHAAITAHSEPEMMTGKKAWWRRTMSDRWLIADHLWPCRKREVTADHSFDGDPEVFVAEFRNRLAEDDGYEGTELLMTLGSLIIGAFLLLFAFAAMA